MEYLVVFQLIQYIFQFVKSFYHKTFNKKYNTMKKITITFALLITVALGLSAQYSIGLYAGSSYCNIKKKVINDIPNINYVAPGSTIGYTFGLKAEKKINDQFSIFGDISYFNKNAIWKETNYKIYCHYAEPVVGIKFYPAIIFRKKTSSLFSINPSFGYAIKLNKDDDIDNYNSFIARLNADYTIKRISITPFIEWDINPFNKVDYPNLTEINKLYFTNYGLKIGYTLFNGKKK